MEKNYKTKKEEMKNEKTAGNAVVFENPEFGKILTQTDDDGEPWFCAKDVCNVLGYKRANDAVSQLVNDLDTAKRRNKVPGSLRKDGSRTVRTQLMLYVNESGFYALVLGSKLPTAVKFKNWVTSEVLPQIRKTGGYIPVKQGESDEETIRHAEEILRATLKEKENLLKNQQVQIDQQKKLIGAGVEPPALCPSYPVLPERPVSALCRLCPHGPGEEPHPLLYPPRPSLRWGTGEAGHRLHPHLPRMDRKRKKVHTFIKGKKVKR